MNICRVHTCSIQSHKHKAPRAARWPPCAGQSGTPGLTSSLSTCARRPTHSPGSLTVPSDPGHRPRTAVARRQAPPRRDGGGGPTANGRHGGHGNRRVGRRTGRAGPPAWPARSRPAGAGLWPSRRRLAPPVLAVAAHPAAARLRRPGPAQPGATGGPRSRSRTRSRGLITAAVWAWGPTRSGQVLNKLQQLPPLVHTAEVRTVLAGDRVGHGVAA